MLTTSGNDYLLAGGGIACPFIVGDFEKPRLSSDCLCMSRLLMEMRYAEAFIKLKISLFISSFLSSLTLKLPVSLVNFW